MCVCPGVSPSDGAVLLVVDLDELPEAAGVVVVGRLGVPEGLQETTTFIPPSEDRLTEKER